MTLRLDVRIDNVPEPVGALIRDDRQSLSFSYHPEYLATPAAMPVSLSLPLRDEPFGDVVARAFFDNLLSEQDGPMRALMEREGLDRSDIAGLLAHLGKDCPGALSVLPERSPPTKVPGDLSHDYIPLSDERLARITKSLHERRRLPDGQQDPSPLAGVQSKIALTRLPDGRLAEPVPHSGAPTTHILKVPDQGHVQDVDRELISLHLSAKLVATANAEHVTYGGISALLVERFDREVAEGVVRRRHQEDFAQALGIPASLKYERRGNADKKFTAVDAIGVLNRSIDPVRARQIFLTGAVFDLLIGNVDAHAKNHAILHLGGGRFELAPRYDVLPTRLDPHLTEEFAYSIGGASKLSDLTAEKFDGFLKLFGFVTKGARTRVKKDFIRGIAHVLAQSLDQLQADGQKPFADLIASNMREFLPIVGLDVPANARERDAAIARGGGWATS